MLIKYAIVLLQRKKEVRGKSTFFYQGAVFVERWYASPPEDHHDMKGWRFHKTTNW